MSPSLSQFTKDIFTRKLQDYEIARVILLGLPIFIWAYFFWGNLYTVIWSNGVLEFAGTDKQLPGHIWLYSMNFGHAKRTQSKLWIKEQTGTEEVQVFAGNLYPFGGHSGSWSGKSSTPYEGVPIAGLRLLELKVEPQRGYGQKSF